MWSKRVQTYRLLNLKEEKLETAIAPMGLTTVEVTWRHSSSRSLAPIARLRRPTSPRISPSMISTGARSQGDPRLIRGTMIRSFWVARRPARASPSLSRTPFERQRAFFLGRGARTPGCPGRTPWAPPTTPAPRFGHDCLHQFTRAGLQLIQFAAIRAAKLGESMTRK